LLRRALDGMSEINREMILLHEIHGLKLEEIARLLALPLGTVKSRSNRARLELAARVREIEPAYGGAGS
jgi:RNA polymerase sigma-70 factor (ECF subfamily)